MVYTEIEQLLKNVAGQVHPVVATNDVYQPVIGTPWCRVTLMPGKSETISLGYQHYSEYQGLYRIDVFIDKGQDISVGNKMVDAFIKHFKANLMVEPQDAGVYTDLKLYIGEVWRETTRFETVWVNIPVYVGWKTHIQHNV